MAGLAGAAEGQLDAAAGPVIVDEHLARADRLGEAHLPPAIGGPDAGDEAKVGAVGDGDGFRLAVERDHHLHRPEDFVLRQPVVGRDAGDQRRHEIMAVARCV